ncbi:hypothetical protein [Streptomyces sp. NPDC048606]|uniref:hypothetical protein n=1 Tax=Streptomyces sp. NPDC048606 TaxID=3154726 RepID=UPI0034409468
MTTRHVSATERAAPAGPPDTTTASTRVPPRGPTPTAAPRGAGLGTGRRLLRALAVAATLPYVALKAAWLGGSRIGIPPDSVLLESGSFLVVANAVTLAMDACVIVLALVLTRPWGMRVPAPVLTLPVFVATGLLAPIVVTSPVQLLIRVVGPGQTAPAAGEPFLDPWVFGVVYGGFIVQALALMGLFVPYARERWGGLWQGSLGPRLPSPTGVVTAAAVVTGAVVAAVHLYWAFGGSAGLPAARVALYSAETGAGSAALALFVLGAATGAVLLARGGARSARAPMALAWVCAAASLCWGGWLTVALLAPDIGGAEGDTRVMGLIYAGQMITGLLASIVVVRSLRSRRTG